LDWHLENVDRPTMRYELFGITPSDITIESMELEPGRYKGSTIPNLANAIVFS